MRRNALRDIFPTVLVFFRAVVKRRSSTNAWLRFRHRPTCFLTYLRIPVPHRASVAGPGRVRAGKDAVPGTQQQTDGKKYHRDAQDDDDNKEQRCHQPQKQGSEPTKDSEGPPETAQG